ncbi:hypothetical protein BC835DRAFT_1424050 [Cytidiella melzeri]|nr:hypothetical protein BC835DRAFT_1424050 [Cytidiella melzeri]
MNSSPEAAKLPAAGLTSATILPAIPDPLTSPSCTALPSTPADNFPSPLPDFSLDTLPTASTGITQDPSPSIFGNTLPSTALPLKTLPLIGLASIALPAIASPVDLSLPTASQRIPLPSPDNLTSQGADGDIEDADSQHQAPSNDGTVKNPLAESPATRADDRKGEAMQHKVVIAAKAPTSRKRKVQDITGDEVSLAMTRPKREKAIAGVKAAVAAQRGTKRTPH